MINTHQITVFCHVSSSGVGVLKGLLYAVGGHDGPLVRKSCEVYDPTTNSWRQVADMNMCRRNAGNGGCPPPRLFGSERCGHFLYFLCVCVCVPSGVCAVNNLLYVVGGDDGSCNLASVEFYNPASDKWTLLPTCMSTGRSYAGTSGALKFHPFILTSSLCFTYSHVFF